MTTAVDLSCLNDLDYVAVEDDVLQVEAEFPAFLPRDEGDDGLSDDSLAKWAMDIIMGEAWEDLHAQGEGQRCLFGPLHGQHWVIPDLAPLAYGIRGNDAGVTVNLMWFTDAPRSQSEADHMFLVLAAVVRAMKSSEGRWNDYRDALEKAEENAKAAEEALTTAKKDATLAVESAERTVLIRVKSSDAQNALEGWYDGEIPQRAGVLGRPVYRRYSPVERVPRGDAVYGITPAEWADLDARRKAGRIKGISKFRAKNPASWAPHGVGVRSSVARATRVLCEH